MLPIGCGLDIPDLKDDMVISFCSVPKHRIGSKRHRVCLEVPHEVTQSESFPKEEVVPMQFEMEETAPPVGPAREPVPQGDEGLAPPGNFLDASVHGDLPYWNFIMA